eukprot:5465533-Amphidinium_carterae.1
MCDANSRRLCLFDYCRYKSALKRPQACTLHSLLRIQRRGECGDTTTHACRALTSVGRERLSMGYPGRTQTARLHCPQVPGINAIADISYT